MRVSPSTWMIKTAIIELIEELNLNLLIYLLLKTMRVFSEEKQIKKSNFNRFLLASEYLFTISKELTNCKWILL